jgi:C4-type Zn-finger protein
VGAEGLFTTVRGVLHSIEKVTLQAVSLDWMNRLRKCIQTKGEYIK